MRLCRLEGGRVRGVEALSDAELNARIRSTVNQLGGIDAVREMFADDPGTKRLIDEFRDLISPQ
jgi:hypothetical protein